MFLGYSEAQKSYSCFHPSTRRHFTSMDVTFFKHAPFFVGGVLSQGECFPVRIFPLENLSSPPSDPLPLSVPCESAILPLVSPSVLRTLQVYTRRHPGRQPPTPDGQASSVAPGPSPVTNLPLSGIEPSHTSFIPITTDDDSPVSYNNDDRPIAIRKEKRNARKPDRYSDTAVYSIANYTSDH
ncbi:hypothetical protein GIB67_034067, partial [Kingdonia uniflora]